MDCRALPVVFHAVVGALVVLIPLFTTATSLSACPAPHQLAMPPTGAPFTTRSTHPRTSLLTASLVPNYGAANPDKFHLPLALADAADRISAVFGPRWNQYQSTLEWYPGLAFAAPVNTTVRSIAHGFVFRVSVSNETGTTVILRHPFTSLASTGAGKTTFQGRKIDDLYSVYTRLDRVATAFASIGTEVHGGDTIGYIGGPFETCLGGTSREPVHVQVETRLAGWCTPAEQASHLSEEPDCQTGFDPRVHPALFLPLPTIHAARWKDVSVKELRAPGGAAALKVCIPATNPVLVHIAVVAQQGPVFFDFNNFTKASFTALSARIASSSDDDPRIELTPWLSVQPAAFDYTASKPELCYAWYFQTNVSAHVVPASTGDYSTAVFTDTTTSAIRLFSAADTTTGAPSASRGDSDTSTDQSIAASVFERVVPVLLATLFGVAVLLFFRHRRKQRLRQLQQRQAQQQQGPQLATGFFPAVAPPYGNTGPPGVVQGQPVGVDYGGHESPPQEMTDALLPAPAARLDDPPYATGASYYVPPSCGPGSLSDSRS